MEAKHTPDAKIFARVPPYFTLDAWRGIAALWVVMLHSCLSYLLNGHQSFLWNPIYLVSIWGQLGVTIFFVISGYCITGAAYSNLIFRKPLGLFCTDRVRRIYPPYFAALLVAVVAQEIATFMQRQRIVDHSRQGVQASGAVFWMANLTLTQLPAGQSSLLVVAWSLCYEVCFYAIMAGLLGFGILWKSNDLAQRLVVLLAGVGILTCGSLAWLCISPATCPFPFQLWYQFGFGSLLFLCFAVGNATTGTCAKSLKRWVWFATVSALALTSLFAGIRSGQIDPLQPQLGHPSTRVQALATIVFCAGLYLLRDYDARLSKNRLVSRCAHMGAFSYSLYLVHLPLLPFVDAGLRRLGFTDKWYLVPYTVQIAVAIVAGYLFFQLVERRFISRKQVRRIAVE